FVDDSTVLYIDASTRRALQYALMMVESDGIDGSLDCLDDLLDSLDGLEDFALPLDDSEDGRAKAQSSMKEQPALPPIWPPIVLPSNISAKSGANVLGSIHFAQRILSALFGYDSAPTASENVHELPLESEQDQAVPLVKSKKADHNWSFIENRFECLCERLRELEPDQTSSKNLWAMGATFLLVTLIARRAYRQPAATLTKILREFLRSVFSPRPQANFSRQAHARYSKRVYPALAADLRDNFRIIPSEEFKAILVSAFAFLLADSRSKRTKFMLVPEFMLLKSLVEKVGSKKFADTDRATVIYKRYFSGADSTVSLAAFISELANIENLSWADHPSFPDLAVLLSKEPIAKDRISSHLQPHLGRFLKI
ncbi:MAG: hypothetical protein U1E10_06420, partial [Bdellovibrionales bacterium]|nr:hypothetical protein [Bdellovibrionales bacterium]